MVDRYQELENHEIVYKLGLTSKNIYFDVHTGIKVNRFIEGDSLNHLEDYDADKIAKLLRTLHTSKILANSDYLPHKLNLPIVIHCRDAVEDILEILKTHKHYFPTSRGIINYCH